MALYFSRKGKKRRLLHLLLMPSPLYTQQYHFALRSRLLLIIHSGLSAVVDMVVVVVVAHIRSENGGAALKISPVHNK